MYFSVRTHEVISTVLHAQHHPSFGDTFGSSAVFFKSSLSAAYKVQSSS